MAGTSSTAHIIQSLIANAVIAIAKGIAAAITGSGAMLAETLHTAADCGNQLLLLLGVKQARRPPSASHPLGHGRAVYFWSFMVALLLFSGGGVFSLYEGVHKLREPEAVESVWIGIVILALSIAIEGWACLSNVREMNRRRGSQRFIAYLRQTKDSDLVVVFGENAAAVLGLCLALVALLAAWSTGDGRWDAAGSLAIGVVLIGVAIFLAVEVKSLLLGESASPAIEATAVRLIADDDRSLRLLHMISVQQGPGEVVVMMKVEFRPELAIRELCGAINDLETRLRGDHPEARWIFVEPDIGRPPAPVGG